MRLPVVLILLIVGFAGCLSGSDDAPSPAEAEAKVLEAAEPFLVQTHGGDASEHFDASLHTGSANVQRIGYHNGHDNSGDPNSIDDGVYYTELAVHEGYVYLARASKGAGIGPDGAEDQVGGFVIIDARDPSRPTFAGEFDALSGFDIDVSHDGALAFFSTQRNTVEEIVGNLQASEDPTDVAPRGVYIVDTRDKTAPELITFQPMPYNGPHTTTYHRVGGRELLFVQTYDLYATASPVGAGIPGAPEGVNPATQRVTVYDIVRNQDGDRLDVGLVEVGHFQVPENAPAGQLYLPHDVYVERHPMRNKLLAYVAYWDMGVRIVDLDGLPTPGSTEEQSPLLPEIGGYREFSPSAQNAIHLAKPFEQTIDDRHITVAEPEIVQAGETGQITFIDTSTPSRPVKACATSYWTLPGNLTVTNFDFSPHNFDTFDGHVALAHNHAGIWIIDAHDAEALCQPRSAGFYMETFQRQDSPQMQPRFWGVFEEQGLLYASDMATGLYILQYTP